MNLQDKVNTLLGSPVGETLNTSSALEITSNSHGWEADFHVPKKSGGSVHIKFGAMYIRSDDRWDVMFAVVPDNPDDDLQIRATNDKDVNPLHVLSGVNSAFTKFMHLKKPNNLSFSANMSERSRIKFYDSMAAKMSREYHMNVSTENVDGYKVYNLTRI